MSVRECLPVPELSAALVIPRTRTLSILNREGGVSDVDRTVLVDIVALGQVYEDIKLLIGRFALQAIAQVRALSVLNLSHNRVDPEEQEFAVGELVASYKLGLESWAIRASQH